MRGGVGLAAGLDLGDLDLFRTISNYEENENCYENTFFLDEHGGVVGHDDFDDELCRQYFRVPAFHTASRFPGEFTHGADAASV